MSITKKLISIFILTTCSASLVFASGDPKAGKNKSSTCAACHGPTGSGVNPMWPKLAGQHAKYTVNQLQEFKLGKKGQRFNTVMMPMAATLSAQDMEDLAVFYAEQQASIGEAKKDLVALGEKIYRGGNLETGVPACMACHGPRGLGNADGGIPKLSGQYAQYTAQQLVAYKDNTRSNGLNQIMTSVVKRMTKQEMDAVASYIEGLH